MTLPTVLYLSSSKEPFCIGLHLLPDLHSWGAHMSLTEWCRALQGVQQSLTVSGLGGPLLFKNRKSSSTQVVTPAWVLVQTLEVNDTKPLASFRSTTAHAASFTVWLVSQAIIQHMYHSVPLAALCCTCPHPGLGRGHPFSHGKTSCLLGGALTYG